MRSRFGWIGLAAFACLACVVGCGGGGGSTSGGVRSVPTATATASLTPKPTATSTLNPTPSPTPSGVGVSCRGTGNALPGTYTAITTTGNVAGTAYTQIAGGGTWTASTYAVEPSPIPPSISPIPTETAELEVGRVPKKKPTPTPSPTPSPTPTPTPTPTTPPTIGPVPTPSGTDYVAYTGAYILGGFNGSGYSVSPTTGCLLLLTTQSGQPIQPGGGFNASGTGTPLFDTFLGVSAVAVASGSITTFTITGLGASSGNGTFNLDNGVAGSVTIQSSQIVTLDRIRQMYRRR
jgi:hypothetical protein